MIPYETDSPFFDDYFVYISIVNNIICNCTKTVERYCELCDKAYCQDCWLNKMYYCFNCDIVCTKNI